MIIWIASYPKSGNTWVRAFLAAYYFCDKGIFDPKSLVKIEDYPNKQFFREKVKEGEIHKHWEESQKNICKEKKVKFLKTHNSLINAFGCDFTSPKYSLGVIYIIRDPRNLITSLKNHNNFNSYEEALTMMQNDNAILSDYKHLKNFAKTTILNSWRINYQSWLRNNSYRRMMIKYEDILQEPETIFKNLVIFINKICRNNEEVNKMKLKNAIETTNFESLRKIEEKGQFTENVFSEKDKTKRKFFYLGPKNNWKDKLDKNMIDIMNNYYKEDLKKFGYEI